MHSSTATSHKTMGSTSSTSSTSTQKPYEPLTPQSPEPPSSTRHSQEAARVAEDYEPSSVQHHAAMPNTTVDPSAPPAYRHDSTPASANAGQGLARRMSKKEYATQLSRMMGDQLAAMSKAQARRGSAKA